MHFYRSRGVPKLLHGALTRHFIGNKNVNAFGNLPRNEEKLLRSRKDDKKYLYQIPPWLRKSQKPVKNETQNEIIVKENNKCKSVYTINRRASPVPKSPPKEKFQFKMEENKPKLTPHFSPNAITLDSPIKNLHKKNLKIPGKEDPFQLTQDPYTFSDPSFNLNKKSNLKKKHKTLLDSLVQNKLEEKKVMDKKETERKECKKIIEKKECKKSIEKKESDRRECTKMIEKIISSKVEEKLNTEEKLKKFEIKKRTTIPKSFDHMSNKSPEDKKKMWKDIIESLELHDVTSKSKIEACSRNKLVEFPNRPVKLSSKEMLYSRGVEKKIPKKVENIKTASTKTASTSQCVEKKNTKKVEHIKAAPITSQCVEKVEKKNPKKIENIKAAPQVENIPKVEQSASASTSIKNLREKKSQAFSESVIILRKEGERLRKEYERTRRKSKQALDRVRANGKKPKLDKTETTEYMKEKLDSQVLNYQSINFNDQKMDMKSDKKSKKIKTVLPPQNEQISKPIIKEALVASNKVSSKIKPDIPKLPSYMNMNKYSDSKDKKNAEHIPARLILPKYPNSTVFDNKFSRDVPQPPPKDENEPKDPKKNDLKTKQTDYKKIQLQTEDVVKINDHKHVNKGPENVYCLPMGCVKSKDVKMPEKELEGIDSLQELLKTPPEPKSDLSRLPKEIKDALIRIGKPHLDQFAMIPQPRTTDMELNLKKALINFQVDQAKLTPHGFNKPEQKLIPEIDIQSQCDFSKFGTKFQTSKPCKKEKKPEPSEIVKIKEDEILPQGKPAGLHLLIHSKVQDLFSKYKCYLHTTIRTLDMNRKIKLEKEKNSILPYGGGNVLNKIRSQPSKSFVNLKPPKKISKGLKPKVLRNGKYRRNLYNKSNNYYIKIKTKPAKKKVNVEKVVHEFLEPMPGLAKKTIPPPPAMAYSEVLSAIYTKKGVSKYA